MESLRFFNYKAMNQTFLETHESLSNFFVQVLTKGADAKVLARLWDGEPEDNIDQINEKLLEYSKQGFGFLTKDI